MLETQVQYNLSYHVFALTPSIYSCTIQSTHLRYVNRNIYITKVGYTICITTTCEPTAEYCQPLDGAAVRRDNIRLCRKWAESHILFFLLYLVELSCSWSGRRSGSAD